MSKIIRRDRNRMSKATILGEPSLPGYVQLSSNMLKRTSNLADLTDVAEARKNLGVASLDDLSVAATPNTIAKRDESGRFKILDAEKTNEPVSLNQLNNKQYALDSNNITGVLPMSKGGLGANNATAARKNLGLGTLATKNSLSWNEVTSKPALAPMPTDQITWNQIKGEYGVVLPQGGTYAYYLGAADANTGGWANGGAGVKGGGSTISVDRRWVGGFYWKIQ